MKRRQRAVLLAGLAIALGALAASSVAGREASLRRSIGASIAVVVARVDLSAGARVRLSDLAIRRVPTRYAPPAAFSSPAELRGVRLAVAVPAGTDLLPALIDDGSGADWSTTGAAPVIGAGQRIAEIVARGSFDRIQAGSRVDVLVTTETSDGAGRTTLALQDAEVVASTPAPVASGHDDSGEPQVSLSLRVTLRQAVTLAEAQNFAREVRVLVRAPGDRGRLPRGFTVSQ